MFEKLLKYFLQKEFNETSNDTVSEKSVKPESTMSSHGEFAEPVSVKTATKFEKVD